MTKWIDTIDFSSKYEVSDDGKIRSKQRYLTRKNGRPLTVRNKELNYRLNKDGYLVVTLHSEDGEVKVKLVHRVVWESFNGRVPEGFEIGHFDCDATNPKLDNLYLCTHKENCNHPITRQRQSNRMRGNSLNKGLVSKYRKAIVCLDMDYNLVKEYDCITNVKDDGFSAGNVCQCCQNTYGKRKNVSKNRIFMYKTDYEKMLEKGFSS